MNSDRYEHPDEQDISPRPQLTGTLMTNAG
jgi:hypothetical protein